MEYKNPDFDLNYSEQYKLTPVETVTHPFQIRSLTFHN